MPTATTARRMFELLEPICLVTFLADECNEEMAGLGHRTYWDGYFASRAAGMLREHRCDGHLAALVGARIGGTEAHVLSALDMGIHPPESFGRIHHLPKKRLAEVMDGLCERGLVDTDGCFTDAGREVKQRIEALTDELAAPPYDALSPAELDELIAELEPITATLVATGSQ
jgi:hypothetical protein